MLRPCGHKLIIQQDALEETYGESQIVIVRENEKLERAAVQTGRIVAMGPDCWKAFRQIDENGTERNGLPWAKIGDHVMYAKYGGAFITDPGSGVEYILLNDEDISVIIEDENRG